MHYTRGNCHYYKKNKNRKGPDGISGGIIKLIGDNLLELLAHIFTECFKAGRFADQSKETSLVLLRKEGRPEGFPSAYRSIYLLAEFGKLLERVIARRLAQHKMGNQEYALSEDQYGFREYRSIIDAISKFREWIEDTIQENGGVTMVISLDVANAFNSMENHSKGSGKEKHAVISILHLEIILPK